MMQNKHEIVRWVGMTRQRGNAYWLLRSALSNPNVIIVCRDLQYSDEFRKRYRRMVEESPWYKRLWWKLSKRVEPKSMSVRENIFGMDRPVVFDNGTLI